MNFLLLFCMCCTAVVAKPAGYDYYAGSHITLPSNINHHHHHHHRHHKLGGILQPPPFEIDLNKFAFNGRYRENFVQKPYHSTQLYAPPLITKDIYLHAPPEEPHVQAEPQPPRTRYRIVFIKAPTPKQPKAALNIKQAPSEEKTIIYVLSKKPDPVEVKTTVQEAPTKVSKPEVHFIKYKTKEEAEAVQRDIQAHYDKLGGTTQVNDEEVVPVASVVGSLDKSSSSSSSSSSSYSPFSSSSSSSSPVNSEYEDNTNYSHFDSESDQQEYSQEDNEYKSR